MVNRVQNKFARGDKVFAKVRGHPPWPAKIEEISEDNHKHPKFHVSFYGTQETAICKLEELFEYSENKEKFRAKTTKRKNFIEGLEQLEADLKNDSPTAAPPTKEKKVVPVEETKKVNSQIEPVNTDSDAELGNLVIDEGEKKKPLKRKSMATVNTPDVPEAKKKRGRPKENTPKQQETTIEVPAEEVQEKEKEKEVVSRSGRKIKPKRFADSDGVETEKNEHHPGRGRPRKIEEAIDNQNSTPAAITKKRLTVERKSNVSELPSDAIITSSTPDKTGRFLPARTFSGENVGIKLDLNRPLSFANDKAQEQWETTNARKAMKLKAQLESGEIFPEQVKDRLDFNVQVPLDGKRPLAKDGNNKQNIKLKWLRIESQLLELDAQIKSNLGLDKANADQCLQAMDVMLNLSIDPLMLKKHPQIVETIKRLRRYIGNLSDWKLNDEETIIFKQKAEQIRQKAEHIYNKFKAMFTIREGQTFWQSFSDQVDHFKELTKDMSEEKIFSLTQDPATTIKKTASNVSLTAVSMIEDDSILAEAETKEGENDNDEKNSTSIGSESK
ncbi:PC4 and SFRS1-interacting protein isoform X2 [Leptopilina boulardi]|uniref:PC4 and SFRS1-interacting protein isoform X2 n=1 Tax=Leptopilina boulardi TaxID=63433 RepID=UPI0021F673F5|nr:PC4 and SFRS1-interacting protein isoform X2 [Leptopilina boulardi]